MMCYDNSELFIRHIDTMTTHRPLPLTSPKQRQGSLFEQRACEFLQDQGLILVVQNWHQPKFGELDLVMIEQGAAWATLVFIEVRQRKLSNFGNAAHSVTTSKQHKVIKAARYFLQQHPEYRDYDCRFDVIAYDTASQATQYKQERDSQPEWIQGAFIATAW
ncbi:YraN family protein [Psychrobacter sp.]|uniref:YraN family protein n=2 Tax=Psychrobacter sp. TaxID=56811 RepID=UPI0026494051|nr:YraN family protein [Psychrobacter sp.]